MGDPSGQRPYRLELLGVPVLLLELAVLCDVLGGADHAVEAAALAEDRVRVVADP